MLIFDVYSSRILLSWLDSQKSANSPEASSSRAEFEKSSLRPGECVMRTLFQDFTQQAARKMEEVMAEPMVYCDY